MSDRDEFTLSIENLARNGAAADGALSEEALATLPRVLRYALRRGDHGVAASVVAEIVEAYPPLSAEATRWASGADRVGWASLASALDMAAVSADTTTLRSLADAVRILSISTWEAVRDRPATLRIVAALREALDATPNGASPSLLADVERLILGWVSIAGGDLERAEHSRGPAQEYAATFGRSATHYLRREIEERYDARRRRDDRQAAERLESEAAAAAARSPDATTIPEGYVLVCPPIDTKKSAKVRDALRGHEHAVGIPLPLAPMPDIAVVRRDLVASFPHAVAAIDTLLSPLVGRATVAMPPVILVGPPGAGKSRLVRRLCEALGVGIWRTSGANADGASFGGTDRRWHSSEPAHPFLAISRARIANPLVLIDEIEKSGTRSDYGRLWDSLLGFLDPETAARHPDPCLQVDLDLSHVGYVATANTLLPLPSPLLDRFRVVEVPEPRAEDLAILVPSLVADLVREQGLDEAWIVPLSAAETDILAAKWRGGSLRRLRAYLGVILRARDRAAARN